MSERLDVTIPLPDGVTLAAWLYLPDGDRPAAGITMAHGFGGTRYHDIAPIAERISNAGYAVLLHDHRNFGDSGGTPRHDINPDQQIEDWRRVTTYLSARDEVDANRVGIWGTSYAGGHALVLAATDRRLKAVFAQVPTISGYQSGLRRVAPDQVARVEAIFAADELAQLNGEAPRMQAFVSDDPAVNAQYRQPEAIQMYLHPRQGLPDGLWENAMTVQSNRRARAYEPSIWVPRIAPTPLMMLVATHDDVAPTDLALAAYTGAGEPKELVLMDGGHFSPYNTQFELSTEAAIRHFDRYLS
ncbi:alpha/beta hydrolase [Frondihabitans australicus]|uniref:Xaa-Pro dipeptidyl-peptidase-like domain-containing protein n=1 Tax=Frondihabitans australicus TaxID=386892 RepID=A0A495IKN9_9MICO|nr:alpha/beta fold hydrolase [Frondihabitans australicus]RKR75851.1 hypothetical protein C8E83_3013 [Frondihabitans australicus]